MRIHDLQVANTQPHAMMVWGATAHPTSVGSGYTQFIQGNLFVGRSIAQKPYYLRLSHNIHTGESWQCAVYAAHILYKAERLHGLPTRDEPDQASPGAFIQGSAEEMPASVIWATGRVSAGGDLLRVNGYEQKLEHSRALFSWCAQNNIPVRCVLPLEDEGSASWDGRSLGEHMDEFAKEYRTLTFAFIRHVDAVPESWLGSSRSGPTPGSFGINSLIARMKPIWATLKQKAATVPRVAALGAVAAVLLLGGGLAGGFGWMANDTSTWPNGCAWSGETPDLSGINLDLPELEVTVVSAPDRLCRSVEGEHRVRQSTRFHFGERAVISLGPTDQICTIEFRKLSSAAPLSFDFRFNSDRASGRDRSLSLSDGQPRRILPDTLEGRPATDLSLSYSSDTIPGLTCQSQVRWAVSD